MSPHGKDWIIGAEGRPVRISTPDQAAVAAAVKRQRSTRAERARDTLDASLRAAGIEGFRTYTDPPGAGGRIGVVFDSPTDAYLAAARLAFLNREPGDPGPRFPAEADATPTIRDWAQAHQSFRAMNGHGANPNSEADLAELRRLLPAAVRPGGIQAALAAEVQVPEDQDPPRRWVERLRDEVRPPDAPPGYVRWQCAHEDVLLDGIADRFVCQLHECSTSWLAGNPRPAPRIVLKREETGRPTGW